MWKIALEVRLILFAIARVVQEAVGIVEDVPLGDGVIAVVVSEFRQRPIGYILLAVCAVLIVGVEVENTGFFPGNQGMESYPKLKYETFFCFQYH